MYLFQIYEDWHIRSRKLVQYLRYHYFLTKEHCQKVNIRKQII